MKMERKGYLCVPVWKTFLPIATCVLLLGPGCFFLGCVVVFVKRTSWVPVLNSPIRLTLRHTLSGMQTLSSGSLGSSTLTSRSMAKSFQAYPYQPSEVIDIYIHDTDKIFKSLFFLLPGVCFSFEKSDDWRLGGRHSCRTYWHGTLKSKHTTK